MFPADKDVRVLPLASAPPPARPARAWTKVLACAALVCIGVLQLRRPPTALSRDSFFWTSNDASALCPGVQGNASYAGYIGLAGDTADAPRRSFYWCVLGLLRVGADSADMPVTGSSRRKTTRKTRPSCILCPRLACKFQAHAFCSLTIGGGPGSVRS